MLSIRIHRHGGPECLQLDQVAVPAPGPGEVQVRHTAIGVNFIDTYHRSGLYPLPLPSALGQEAAGVVAAVGDGVRTYAVGDRVGYCTTGPGAYSQVRNVPTDRLLVLPDDVDDVTAAASLLKGLTVSFLIRSTYAVQAGQTVLWHAAAGGVGQLAVQWLKQLGAVVIGTAGSAEKVAEVRALGADHVIDYRNEDFVARVREITGGAGVPVVYDSVGHSTLPGSLRCLARRGMLVSFGNASGKPDAVDPLALSAQGSAYLTRPKLGDYCTTRAELEDHAAAWFAALRGGVQVKVSHQLSLADAAHAHHMLESRATQGSVVLLP